MKRSISLLMVLFAVLMVSAQDKPEGLFINSKAPDFKLKDKDGKEVRLKDELKKGKVVLVFYRGQWCPFCNRELSHIEDSLQLITDKGAEVVAVTAELPANIEKTIEKTKAAYPILYDEGLKTMKAYDVLFEVDEHTVLRYKTAGIDLLENNGKLNGNHLPVPAVFIIDKEGFITFRYFEPDYKKRVSVKEIVANL